MPKAIVVNKEEDKMSQTYYLLIVDASSSMNPLTNSSISGVNEQIDSIKQLEKEHPNQSYFMSFIHFNNVVTVEYTNRPATSLEHISEKNYKCNGMTALLDAIGVGVRNLNESISEKVESGQASAVVVIITDGEENTSMEFDGKKRANIDSISTAKNYGISTHNVVQFSADEISNAKVYKSMSKSFKTRAMAMDSGRYDSDSFISDEDKDITTK